MIGQGKEKNTLQTYTLWTSCYIANIILKITYILTVETGVLGHFKYRYTDNSKQ